MENYKILSLDGGGSWALLQALALQHIYQTKYPDRTVTGHEVLRDFDMVIANSGGSIVLAGLCCDFTLEGIIGLFNKQENRQRIFHKLRLVDKYFPAFLTGKFIGPRYAASKKLEALNDNFKAIRDIPLEDLPEKIGKKDLDIIVCAFDHVDKRARFFRSNKSSNARAATLKKSHKFDSVTLVEAVHASSNAPVNYFDLPAMFRAGGSNKLLYLWDGALGGFNNPVAAGITEAVVNQVDINNIKILSIGTGNTISAPSDDLSPWKKMIARVSRKHFKWLVGGAFFKEVIINMITTIMLEPPDWSNYMAFVMRFGGKLTSADQTKFVRLSPLLYNPDPGNLQLAFLVTDLLDLDLDLILQSDIEKIKAFFKGWVDGAIPNQPVQHTFDETGKLITVLGHGSFQDGVGDWLK
jgi:hypothetical protein